MRVFPNGEWVIESIIINRETVMNDDGFRSLRITDDEMIIHPSEMKFRITLATSETAVLESRGQVFYANFKFEGQSLNLELTRPKFKETIQIEASLAKADAASTVHELAATI